ncbi:MAG: DNA repair protein RecO [Candidatus Omnitrophica bacterium]|nr:DNA repair protein RecO [Candidatus Omnitrophota bacterium]MBU1995582.1 DNA repair protein RecO [Candidatus Omnitrophota bacterium]MBU4332895.1 DNA repair protein RecO [Candidatus Omnitrophota bacterium]
MIVSDEGIILKTFDLRETSKIAIFFTKNHGRVKGVLKGIRKNPKKFGSSLEKFSINDFVYYEYARSEFNLVSQCDLKQFFFNIRQDYKRNIAANYILELVDSIMPLEQVNKMVYKLMLEYLNSLETVKDIDKLVHVFQIKILLLSGFRPHIDSCVKCNKIIHGRARFSMTSGGLICSNCPTKETSFNVISKGAIASILHIEQGQWDDCLRLGLTESVRKELKYILNNFLIYHLEKRIRSSKFLN